MSEGELLRNFEPSRRIVKVACELNLPDGPRGEEGHPQARASDPVRLREPQAEPTSDDWEEATRHIREWVRGGGVSTEHLAVELRYWAWWAAQPEPKSARQGD